MLRVIRRAVAGPCLAAGLLAGVTGCGSSTSGATASSVSTTLTIYSSLPLQGPDAAQSLAIVQGEKLALADHGARVGSFTVKYVSLDDSSLGSGGWDSRQSAKNARTAVQDRSSIAYLGDFNTGATAITLPTLNEAGILQISPATTLVGLTRTEGADKGEPAKYYPTGTRTFGRVIQADDVQARAQIAYQKAQGCKLTYLVHDNEAYGKSLADLLELLAPPAGIQVAGGEGIDPNADDYSATVSAVANAGADCVFFGANKVPAALRLFAALHAAQPKLRLFGPNALASPELASGLGPALSAVTYLTSPQLATKLYPPAGQAFLRRFRAAYGTAAEMYGMYGYEAMQLALLAIQRAGSHGNDQQSVVNGFFGIKDRRSILGTYSIDADGDTSLTGYGAYRVAGGRLVFAKLLMTPTT